MKRVIRLCALAPVISIAMIAAAAGQEAKPAPAAQEAKPTATGAPAAQPSHVPLKLQLVLSRYQGEKKISSVPYSLTVVTAESPTRLRMSVQVPVPSSTFGGGNGPATSYTLKDVGTNIDCAAQNGQERGLYQLNITVTDTTGLPASSVVPKTGQDQQVPAGLPPVVFRYFTSTFNVLLRDGQTGQYTSATDPVSGEVLKIDATLNVLK